MCRIPPPARSIGPSPFLLLLLGLSLSTGSAADPSDQDPSTTPTVVAVHGHSAGSGGPDSAQLALVISGLQLTSDSVDPTGWTIRRYAGGTFEVRPLLPPSGTSAGALGERCGAGRLAALRTRTKPALRAGYINGNVRMEEGGPLGPPGACAHLAGTWSPDPPPFPHGVYLLWQAELTEGTSAAKGLTWGSLKSAFR